ncbi:MAG: prephenate dehydrogenase/arogenate dehydrogenase family protein [Chloroflexi bacterium]|nr:prephenate dehydrogenase/arogenate dehydrogenase family protein [Chloroflexota bacterium]
MRITIIGLGLIGGSIGMAIRRSGMAGLEICGFARSEQAAVKALARGAVDRVSGNLEESVSGADTVFICTPVKAVEGILETISPCLGRDCLVTDTSSTKKQVMNWARRHLSPKGIDFIGGHPMAGKEKPGIEAADPDILFGCTYCICPAEWTSLDAVNRMRELLRLIQADPLVIEPERHDMLVAGISHLPALLSAALVDATTGSPDWRAMAQLAATGYRDVTRLASSDPKMNADIFSTNSDAMLAWIDRFSQVMAEFRAMLASGSAELEPKLAKLCRAREHWLEDTKRTVPTGHHRSKP